MRESTKRIKEEWVRTAPRPMRPMQKAMSRGRAEGVKRRGMEVRVGCGMGRACWTGRRRMRKTARRREPAACRKTPMVMVRERAGAWCLEKIRGWIRIEGKVKAERIRAV